MSAFKQRGMKMKLFYSVLALCVLTMFILVPFEASADLIGYWPLNETSGITATNLAPGGTTGILTNGPAWINDDDRGRVISFDGNDDFVIAGSIPAMDANNNFTWSFWAYSQQGANSDVVLGNRWNTDGSSSTWIKFTTSKFEYPGAFMDYVDMPPNVWVHHAAVKFGSRLIYYRNGIPLITNTTATAGIPSRPFNIGGDAFNPSVKECYQGRLDDVAIFTHAIPPDGIAGLADGTYTPFTVPHYPLGSFDLADAVGGGDGRLPGSGGYGDLAAAVGVYSNYPANLFVDGTFVPNNNSTPAVIDGAGHTYDFNPQTSAGYYNPWRNGLNMDTNPSNTNGVPDLTGDPGNHSLLSGHANKGICFDLDAVRDFTGRSISNFTAYIGDSIPKAGGSICYYVFVDGVLVANRNNITDDYDFITVNEVSTGHYLSIAISDANNGIGADHGFIGDPFLTLIPYTPPEPPTGTIMMIN